MMNIYTLHVKKALALVATVAERFRGDSLMSFEGDLSAVDFTKIAGLFRDETAALKRNTIAPRQDFVVLPLTQENVNILTARIFPRIGIRCRVLHIEVEERGHLVFGTYDQFSSDGTWITAAVGEEFVTGLVREGAVASYETGEI